MYNEMQMDQIWFMEDMRSWLGGTDAISVSSTVAARIPGMPTVQFRGRSLKH
jgi:hypothetical protein